MSCCGGRGTPRLMRETPAGRTPASGSPAPHPVWVDFEYTGATRLEVRGPITRLRYVFPHPGARLPIDSRDAGFFVGIPHLKRAKAPSGDA